MKRILSYLSFGAALFAGPVHADAGPVVVELYTSQGCSSCPPADEMLAELAIRDDVIALALHVDYWDYIGWADVFANPAYTRRQQAYSRAAGSPTIYTPQMVIGGVDHVIGSRPMQVTDILMAHRDKDNGVDLAITRNGDAVQIDAASDDPAAPMVVQLVRYTPSETVSITRGENAGREMTYANIVNSWQVVGSWDGVAPLDMDVDVTGSDPVVVLIQGGGTDGPILAAARLR